MTKRLKERRGTRPDGLPAAAAESQQTGGSGVRRRYSFWAGGVLFIAGIMAYGLFITDLLGGSRAAGEPAPDVAVNTAMGEFRLSQQRGKVLLLYFSFPG